MDLAKYQKKVKPLEVQLTDPEEKLTIEYLVNYATMDNMQRIGTATQEAVREDAEEGDDVPAREDWVTRLCRAYSLHLALAVESVDVTNDGKKVPFKTEEDKIALWRAFSFQDLKLIVDAIQGDIIGPLAKDSTDSSDGSEANVE